MNFYKQPFSSLEVEFDKHILTVTLANPEMRNAINMDIVDGLEKIFGHAQFDDEVRVVILTGKGKSFCAGGDLKSMENRSGMFAGEGPELRKRYMSGIQRIPLALETFNKPIVGMIGGAAIGAGCDLACMCDIRIGSEQSKFGETFSKLGLVPGDGGPFFLTRVVGYAKAMELYLTGDVVNADEALDMGLLNHLVSESDLKSKTLELACKISKNAPLAIQMTKEALKSVRFQDIHSHLNLMATYQGLAQRSQDHFEGIEAFKEKREPHFTGQ